MLDRLSNPYLLLVLTTIFWTLNSVVGRAFSDLMSPLTLNFLRWTLALLLLAPFTWALTWQARDIIRQHFAYLALLSVLSVGAFNALLYWGLKYTTVTTASLVQSSGPVLTLLMAFLILRTTINWKQVTGILLSIGGVITIVTQGAFWEIIDIGFNPGDIIVLVAILLWALYSVLLRRKPENFETKPFLTIQIFLGTLFLIPLAIWDLSTTGYFVFVPTTFYVLVYVAVFPSIAAFFFWNRGVQEVGPATAGMFLYLMPVFGILSGAVLLGERPEYFHGIGIALIFTGVWLATRKPSG